MFGSIDEFITWKDFKMVEDDKAAPDMAIEAGRPKFANF